MFTKGRSAPGLLWLTILIIGLAAWAGIAAGSAQADADKQIRVRPLAPKTVLVGQTFTVRVRLDGTAPVRGIQLAVKFAGDIVACEGIEPGSLFVDWAAAQAASLAWVPNPPRIDNGAGMVAPSSLFLVGGRDTGPSGVGDVVRLRFVARSAGLSVVELVGVQVFDHAGDPAANVVVEPGAVEVVAATPALRGGELAGAQAPTRRGCRSVAPWDVNGDGRLNVLDAATVGMHWQKVGPPGWIPADVNGDGRVNMLDAALLAIHWRALRDGQGCDHAPSVVLSLAPASQVVEPGQAVTVSLVISSALALRTAQYSVGFDPAVLQAVHFEPGPFFREWATANGGMALVFPNPPPLDNERGKAGVVSITIMGGSPGGPSGQGTVGTFEFRVREEATGQVSALTLGDVEVGDADVEPVADVALNHGSVTVIGPTATPSDSATATAEATGTPSATAEATVALATPTASEAGTPESTPSLTVTCTPTMANLPSPTATLVPSATATTPLAPTVTATPTATPNVRIGLSPVDATAPPGGSLDVVVTITTDIPIRTMQCALRFDPAVLQATGFESGRFLRDWAVAHGGTELVYPSSVPIDNTIGKAGVISVNIMGGEEGGPTGSGEFGTFRLKVKADATGGSDLTLEAVNLGDANSDPVQGVVITGARMTVAGALVTATPTPAPTGAASATATSVPTGTATATPAPSRTPFGSPSPTATLELRTNSKVRVSPERQTVAPGALFDVSVVLEPDQPIITAQTRLAFDPSLVEVRSVSEGDLFKNYATAHGGTSLLYPTSPEIDNVAGTVGATSVTVMGAGPGGPSTSGAFLIFHMAAKTGVKGTSPLTLSSVELGNAQSDPLTGFTVIHGQVTVDENAPTATVTPAASGTVTAATTGTATTPTVTALAAGGTRTATAAVARSAGEPAMATLAPTPMPAVVSLADKVSADNTLQEDLSTSSGLASIFIPAGTRVQTADGQPVHNISITAVERPPAPPRGRVIVGFAFDYGPNGVTFSPPAQLSLAYDEASLPRGNKPEDLVLAFFDEASGQWMELAHTLDPVQRTLTAPVDHFTVFAILGLQPGTNWRLIGALLGLELIGGLGVVGYVIRRRRQSALLARRRPPFGDRREWRRVAGSPLWLSAPRASFGGASAARQWRKGR